MFKDYTFEFLLDRMLSRVPKDIDKREGSVIYDALAPAAAELAQMYIDLDVILRETFADTASRQYLILRAKERGLKPYEAAKAVGRGEFNKDIPIGSRFNIDGFNFAAVRKLADGEHAYALECETAGEEPNHCLGRLTPINTINGLAKAELTEILIPGEDEEPTEDFRKRYMASFKSEAFGGNRADYKEKVNAVQGVGGVKVYRAWNGGGTVKLVIVDSAFKKPSDELVGKVQEEVDPVSGEGLGIAPIDHIVTVSAADEELINIETDITYSEGWSFEDMKPYIEETVDKYLEELNGKWQETERAVVRISQIETRILDLEGVTDIGDTKINGSGSNYTAAETAVLKRGDIVG